MIVGLPRFEPYTLPTANEIPAPVAPWRPSRARSALLIHDMQGYFVRAFRPDPSPIEPAIANIAAIRSCCDALGVPVFYTAQPGRQDPRDRGLQTAFWGPGMSEAPADQHVIEPLAPQPHHTVVTKWRYSALRRSDFETRLRDAGRDQLIVTGLFAHIGCLLTAADAFMCDIEPFFVADAVADFSRTLHDRAVEYAAGRCAVAVTAASLMDDLRSTP